MTQNMVPAEVVETDHKLEGAASKASEALAKHRWHWTLDETNPNRVGIQTYARAVGRSTTTIAKNAHGYANWKESAGALPLIEAIERARMSADREAIVDAVADANKVSFKTARQTYNPDIKRVREAVEDAVERKPDITPEEKVEVAKRHADFIARSKASEHRRAEDRKRQRTATYMLLDAKLDHARRDLKEALDNANRAEMGDEEIRLLQTALEAIKTLTALIGSALAGESGVDWDAELAKIGGDH